MTQPIHWQKSSFSGGGDGNTCVELATAAYGAIRLRESDEPGTVLSTTRAPLSAFLREIGTGRLSPIRRRG